MNFGKILRQINIRLNLNPGDKKYFLESLALLVGSGIGIADALDSIRHEVKSSAMRMLIDEMVHDIDGGSNLAEALDKASLFPSYVINLIKIGEESGNLSTNLKVIVDRQEKESDFRSKTMTAFLYPSLILSLTFGLAVFVTWFVLPRLTNIFNSLDIDPPLLTRIFIQIGEFLDTSGDVAVPIFVAAVVSLVFFLFGFSKTKFIGEELLLRFPGVNTLIVETEISRFAFVLGTLLEAGLPIEDALRSLADIKTTRRFSRFYRKLASDIPKGDSFSQSFASIKGLNRIFPRPIQQMIISAEKSAELPGILLKLGEIYEKRLENTTKNLAVMLEPILLVIVWLGVLLLAVAIILPIYSLVGNFNAR
ncbi:type II secretion system F family protein [Candidatus Dojkabacteria bacterium]|nr:type II secretion system F family protein [Candidatus Dojkabacteria bacterium]